MNVDKGIFKAYDIRGVYPTQLDANVAYAMGKAVATLFLEESNGQPVTLAVGGDMRISTPELKARLMEGLTELGINVVDVGLVSTPTYYYAAAKLGLDGGVQVSASHNPKEYNGFKIVRKGGQAMSGETGILKLYDIITAESYKPAASSKGTITKHDGIENEAVADYLAFAGHPEIKPFKIVIDTANAMGSIDYTALFNKIPGQVEKMFFDLDGTFPNHEADPIKPENTEQLRKRVVESGADLGIAADGDSDRLFIIDEKGETIASPILYALIAKGELLEHPDEAYAYEIRLGMIINDIFEGTAAKLVQAPVGHSLTKKLMLENNAVFGGEVSGHYFFRFPFGTFEAPGYLVIRLLAMLTQAGVPLSQLTAPYKKYFSSGEVNTKVDSRAAIEAKVEMMKSKYSDGKQTLIDGVKVEYPDYWFSVRPSNTEPVMRLVVEAKSRDLMEQKRDEILALIRD